MKKLILTFATLLFATTALADAPGSRDAEHYHSLAEKKAAGLAREIVERVTLSGLIEVEAGFETGDQLTGTDIDSSDIVLATAQLGLGVAVSETVSGDLIFLYEEEPGSQVEIDEATVNFDDGKYFARVGRQYVPFGAYVSHFISDPMLLDLGETQATAILGGVRIGSAELSLFAFNGDADKAGDDDHIDDFGASLTVAAGEALEFGASYLSDLADTGAELVFDEVTNPDNEYSKRAAGWSAYFVATVDAFELSAEALGAADKLVDLGAGFDEPFAWNVEVAYAVDAATELALRVEGSDEIAEAPELQYGICLSRGVGEHLSLSLEYLHGEFDQALNAPLDTRDVVTAQLGLEF